MKLFSKEYYEVMEQFEKDYCHLRLDRDACREYWKIGEIYQNGETNNLFKAYLKGYSLGKSENNS